MKNLSCVTKILPCIVILVSCHSSHKTVIVRPAPSTSVVVVQQPQPQSIPPGQAKKVYGSQSAKPFAPGQQKKQVIHVYPLIIVRTPTIVVYTFSDGRHYHRNSDGMIYWLGKDNRFYLDDSYISKVKYDDKEYNEWKEKKDHADKAKNKDETTLKVKENGNKDNNGSSSNDHSDRGKNKEQTSNSKEKDKGNKDNSSSSSTDQKKTKENKHQKG